MKAGHGANIFSVSALPRTGEGAEQGFGIAFDIFLILAFEIAGRGICPLEGDQPIPQFHTQVVSKSLCKLADHIIGQIEVGIIGRGMPVSR